MPALTALVLLDLVTLARFAAEVNSPSALVRGEFFITSTGDLFRLACDIEFAADTVPAGAIDVGWLRALSTTLKARVDSLPDGGSVWLGTVERDCIVEAATIVQRHAS
jgi:hypothetical protein